MNLRQAAQQALEALENAYMVNSWAWVDQKKQVITALRAALAEPENQSQSQTDTKVNPAEPEQPVAWMKVENFIDAEGLWDERVTFNHDGDGKPLYTAPTPRKPLTDEQIVTMYAENPSSDAEMIEFARAIERAHGIGGGE